MVMASLQSGAKPYDQAAYGAAWMQEIGLPWSNQTSPTFPTKAVGDTVDIAAKLFSKYC